MKESISAEKQLYFELFELYKKRLKSKHLTYEAYRFERESAKSLAFSAHDIMNLSWEVRGYFPFMVYHPTRQINAPMYIDRIIEQWFVEKYIQPVFVPQLYEFNMACQPGKGPFLTMDYVKAAIAEIYSMYGTDFCVFQFDVEGYFDNFRHDTAKAIMQEIGEEGLWMYEKIVDSFKVEDSYGSRGDPDKFHEYGVPKGNLPSQWTGIIFLNELDWEIYENPSCLFNIRYMDDGLNFFHTIAECRECYEDVKEFLDVNELGIRLHPKKTYYAPISRGFTFCGWHYSMEGKGKIHVRIKNTKKKEMEHRLKIISEEVRTGKMSLKQANTIRDGMFEYLSHGTESNQLIKYMKHQYPFPVYKKKG
ncbi:MAG: hypothetical protein IJI65_02745 [Lachnospiraceae bacterium]|nr:hypothetical protein [Lachnospiraceae bacterium]